MNAIERRESIYNILQSSPAPVSAGVLSREMGVSRQVIVGDIALLRAEGRSIIATARGYATSSPFTAGRYLGKIACQHSLDNTGNELLAIVSLGGEVLDVIVEHYLYGEITGQLNIASPADVQDFILKLTKNQARLLSELTDGLHLHTIACKNADVFRSIVSELDRLGYLYKQ